MRKLLMDVICFDSIVHRTTQTQYIGAKGKGRWIMVMKRYLKQD